MMTCERWSGGGTCAVYCSSPPSTVMVGSPGYAIEVNFPRRNPDAISGRYFGVMMFVYGVPSLLLCVMLKLRADRLEAQSDEADASGRGRTP